MRCHITAAIWNCLNHYDFADAIFLAERLRAEVDSDETLFLLATCYYRAGKKMQAYSALRARKLNSSKCKFLMAKCCVDLEKIPEAELVLTGGDVTRFQTVEDVENEYGEESAFVLQIIGRIYYKSERNVRGADALRKSLKICPYLWQSYKELCDHGEKPDPNKVFQVVQHETPVNCQNSFNVGSNNFNGHVENIVFNSNNSSTPVQTLGLIVNNSMSGIRQFTPDESQFSLLRAPAAVSKPNKYRNLYGLSPLSPSFGVLPLDSSPAEGYVISPSGTLPENDDQKIIPKRQLLARKETITPLQVAKPVVFSQSGNTALVTNTPNIPASAPLRRSSRVTNNNYNVKENNKSPKFTSPKSPSRKTKSIKLSKNSKSTFGDLNEKNKLESDSNLSIQNACQQVLALQKQSMEGLMALLRNFGTAYLYLAHYDLNKALDSFLDLPMPQQNTALVMSYCGKAHVALHQYKEAIRYFERVREKEPYRDSMMEIYSTALWHLHKEKDLSSLAHDLLQCDRYSPSTWSVAGNCVSLHKEHDVAIKFFERAVQLDPDFAYAHTLLGHEFVITEELDKAMTCYRHAIRVDPRLYNAWYGLGSIYYKQEKYQLAEIHYKKALSIHPTSAVIMCHIGVVQNALQKPFTALDTLNEALQIHPKSALCKFHRANLYFHGGRFQEALQELQELQELVPKESSVFYLTGKVHKKLGNDHLSLMYISWATDLDPKGANSQVREASDPLINNSVVPDIGGVLSPSGDQPPADGPSTEAPTTPAAQASITEPVDMDETL
ncbi:cell division cycle protein 27 homolog isoform X2 [Planococcus citri]|uniref:cell division cycle protein 27 homolog isoform X2 n=1 Tax=Planococcus citri TaxID=170843 RepID=UPI0031F95852